MRQLTKLMLVVALVLSASHVFAAAAVNNIEIAIDVNINSTVSVTWADGGTDVRHFTINNASLNTSYDTLGLNGNANIFNIVNASQVPVAVSIGCNSQGNWVNTLFTAWNDTTPNAFYIQISKNHAFTGTTPTPSLLNLPGGVSSTATLVSPLATGATQPVDVLFHTPAILTTTGAGGAITVIMTASAL